MRAPSSYGKGGESGERWKEPGQTLEQVKRLRHEEATQAFPAALPPLHLLNASGSSCTSPNCADLSQPTFVDITDVVALKQRAMGTIKAQQSLHHAFTDRAAYRATHAGYAGGQQTICYAEAFQRVLPQAGSSL